MQNWGIGIESFKKNDWLQLSSHMNLHPDGYFHSVKLV